MALKIMGIRFLDHNTGSYAYFNLYVDCFLDYLFKASWHSILLFHLDLDKGFKAFLKIAAYSGFGGSPNGAKFY